MSEARFSEIIPVQVEDGKVITQYLLVDSLGRLMGYWLLLRMKLMSTGMIFEC